MDKQLKNKAIKIKGKDYVTVDQRVLYFNETYTNGCIKTKLIKMVGNMIIVRARVYPNMETPQRYFTGYAQEVIGEGIVNKTSALENAETSAVGRALAMMGIGVIESIASADEMNKAFNATAQKRFYAVENQAKKDGRMLPTQKVKKITQTNENEKEPF